MDKKPCFVIAPIGEEKSETRARSDKVLKHVIRPAIAECGYAATRADEISGPGLMITTQVIQRIVDDPLVVADLTGRNPNVFYELAIRHAIRKPLVQLIQAGEQLPFDVAQTRTIQLDHTDLDSVEEAKQKIIRQIRSLESDPTTMQTPISVSLDLKQLRQSTDPQLRWVGDLIESVADLRSKVESLPKVITGAVCGSQGTASISRILDGGDIQIENLRALLDPGESLTIDSEGRLRVLEGNDVRFSFDNGFDAFQALLQRRVTTAQQREHSPSTSRDDPHSSFAEYP